MLSATPKTVSLFFLILVPVWSAPAPQATDIGSFDSMLQEISSSLFTDGTFTDATSTGSGDPASTTETYVTRVSLVGGPEITLAPGGATGDTTVLGSSTYTLAVPTSTDSSVSSSDSSSGSAGSGSSSSSSSTSPTSSPTSSSSPTTSSPSSTSTKPSSSSSTSTNKPSSTTSSTSSTSSSTTSPSSDAAVSLRPFEVPSTAGIVTVLLGLFFGAWIC
ncbi:hypothetical protein EDD18DRAFT_1142344 [Armillaria luteobubalina]|uniref:Uncharacterized protein n=1 Tax=Armillaria luteobubalina TaxID=153913 RepID=A0AA39QGN2_9AGAR|nr:hypothetical protein EDD18DRAFT_1142344 [Armillaria luteobubalina]